MIYKLKFSQRRSEASRFTICRHRVLADVAIVYANQRTTLNACASTFSLLSTYDRPVVPGTTNYRYVTSRKTAGIKVLPELD